MSLWNAYGLELHEQRLAELAAAAKHHRLLRELEAPSRTRQSHPSLIRTALSGAGARLVTLGHWLQTTAEQPSFSHVRR